MKNLFYAVTLIFLAACATGKNPEKKIQSEVLWDQLEMTADTAARSLDLTVRKRFHASETVFNDLVHTKLEVSFDWQKSWMYGKETLTAKPHFYASDSLILDAKGMEIKSVKMGANLLNYTYDGAFLRIKLDKTYQRDEIYTLVIDYIAKPNDRATSGSAAITSDKGLYFINPTGEDKTIMPQIWTQGETEASSVWFPTIDAPNVKTTQEMLITVDNKYLTLSNGKMLKSVANTDGTRTDHWKQELPHAPYLFMMGIGEFKVVKDSYTRADGTSMEVNYYVEPQWEKYGKDIFGETPAMIAFFSKLTGVEYPWDKYHQIIVRDYVSGAMENTGAVIFGDYAYKTDRELLDEDDNSTIAHELFHHWFGDLVTCESWSNLPLNESFANYSQYLWDEHRYGIDQADYNAEIEKDGYYASSSSGSNHNLIWYDYDDKEQMFDGHSYNKGGRILHMLRSHLGDEAFFQGLKLYLKTNQFKAAEFHHLRLAFEEVSGQDLNWFFDQWFLGAGHPVLDIDQYFSEGNKEVILTVYQNQELGTTPLYRLPVQVMVYDDGGEHLHHAVVDKLENKLIFPVQGKLHNVIFDYQQSILGKMTENKPQEQYIHQYYNGKRYLAKQVALINGSKKESAEATKMILDALNDSFWDIRLQAIQQAAKLKDQAQIDAKMKVLQLAKRDPKSAVRAQAVSFLADYLSKMEVEALCTEIISSDKSYNVIGTALGELSKINPVLAANLAKDLENEPANKMKSTIAQIYAMNGSAENLSYFEKIVNEGTLAGYDAIICLNAFTIYMSRQDMETQKKALALYQTQYEKGGLYTRMFMAQNVQYLIDAMRARKKELDEKVKVHEKNKETAEADKLRNMSSDYDSIIDKLNVFYGKVEAEESKKAR